MSILNKQQLYAVAITQAQVYMALDKQCTEAGEALNALPFPDPDNHKNAEQLVEKLLTRIKAVSRHEVLVAQRKKAYDNLLFTIRSLADIDK